MLVPDVLNPLFAAIFRGVEDAALEEGYTVILSSTEGHEERESEILLTRSTFDAAKAPGAPMGSRTVELKGIAEPVEVVSVEWR